MTTRVLSSEPVALLLDGDPTVAAAETSIGVVTVNGSTIAAIDASLAGKVEEAPEDGSTYGRKDGGWVTVGGGPITTDGVTNASGGRRARAL